MSTMDFFGHQDQARRNTARLVWLFVAAVVCIDVLIYVAAKTLLVATEAGSQDVVDWPVFGAVTALVLLIVGGAMLIKTAQLKGGGAKVAEMLGGRQVAIDTKDPKERMLRNVVEEMSIASGVPVPDIFVLDHETGINAFAAGWTPADAAVAVTRGGLDQFSRDELQGVIAHEFSHVFHGDMRLNIRLMGTLFGIICIAVIGRIILRGAYYSGGARRSSSKKDGGAAAILLFGVALIAIGYIGVFFARLIQAAVSRQREFLADASAVTYTRNPRGIGMALAKIGGIGAKIENPHAEEASHMLFADGMSRFAGAAMATHPPLEKRIERVLPGFLQHNKNAQSMAAAVAETPLPAQFAQAGAAIAGFAAAGPAGGRAAPAPTAATSRAGIGTASLLGAVGDPSPDNVDRARRLLDELPLDLTVAAHEPHRAPALVYALLLDEEQAQRTVQLRLLAADQQLMHDVQSMHRDLSAIDRGLRLPLIELAMPALRSQPEADRRQLRQRARALAMADQQLSPFEFALLKMLERHVRIGDERPPRRSGRPDSLVQRRREAAVVLSAIAHAGADGDDARAASAFARGRRALSLPGELTLLPIAQSTPQQLDPALEALAGVSPFGKRNLLTACAEVAADDGRLEPDEVDLIRALGELWDCPVPLPEL